mmetsp:Transcript_72264/g.200326  ORF Transcript_72264/g.200326 Transcript_72264/m.200326 type:complete len:191 (+) Transcript_72264:56-628(+)
MKLVHSKTLLISIVLVSLISVWSVGATTTTSTTKQQLIRHHDHHDHHLQRNLKGSWPCWCCYWNNCVGNKSGKGRTGHDAGGVEAIVFGDFDSNDPGEDNGDDKDDKGTKSGGDDDDGDDDDDDDDYSIENTDPNKVIHDTHRSNGLVVINLQGQIFYQTMASCGALPMIRSKRPSRHPRMSTRRMSCFW